MKFLITNIDPLSIAEEIGIEKGSYLIKVNDVSIKDRIDYLYHISNDFVELTIQDIYGNITIYNIEKNFDEDIGLNFISPLMDEAKSCNNNCIFCFVHQLPKGMRKSLYFKDDDSRLSFMQGNFITLTNMTKDQLSRIADYGIYPVNISVHSTNPVIRKKMMKSNSSQNILEQLKYLYSRNVIMNSQIVLVPSYNDGKDLDSTIEDLYSLNKYMKSVAIVPVGITKHRKGLEKISPFNSKTSREIIDRIERFQIKFLNEIGTRFVFISDEFFLVANSKIPGAEYYENYSQIENGVGLVRFFIDSFSSKIYNFKINTDNNYMIITGKLFEPVLNDCILRINQNNNIKVIGINNNFFGNTITVTGLLTFDDIVNQVKEKDNITVIIPNCIFNSDGITLDDKTAEDFKSEFSKIIFVDENAKSLLDAIRSK